MRKLGFVSALVCGVIALGSVSGKTARADEPPDASWSWKQTRPVPAVLTSRSGRRAEPASPARTTPAAADGEDTEPAQTPWIIRGTLGM